MTPYMPDRRWRIGFATARALSLFPCRADACQSDRPSKLLCFDFRHHTKAPLQSSFASRPCAPFGGHRPTRGFGPHRDIHGARPHTAKVPKPSLRSVHRLSQPLDGFLRAPCLQACFIPQPRPGFIACPGASLPAQRLPPYGGRRPPCRSASGHSPAEAGCHPRSASTPRLPSTRGRVVRAAGFSCDPSRSPPQVFVPSRSIHTP